MEIIMSSFLGVFVVALIVLICTGIATILDLIMEVFKKKVIIKKSTLTSIGCAAIVIIVVEILLLFIIF